MKKEKDPFEDLPDEFKDSIAQSDPLEIRAKIAEVSLNNLALLQAKKEDQDLLEKHEAYKHANEPYSEGVKMNKLKLLFCRRVLQDKGNVE